MEHETLTAQADKILQKKVLLAEDKTLLGCIKRSMVLEYSKYIIGSAEAEQHYETARNAEYIRIKSKKREDGKRYTDDEANRLSKQKAEEEHGDRRVRKSIAQAIRSQIDHIESVIIDYNVEKKFGFTDFTK